MKLFIIIVEALLVAGVFLYFNQRVNLQERKIKELEKRIGYIRSASLTDMNVMREKYYHLEYVLGASTSAAKDK